MADAKQCDRCEKYYSTPKLIINKTNPYPNGRPILSIDINTFGLTDRLDLCPSCSEKFRKWFGDLEKTKLK